MQKIGFIGLGHMGTPMATNLLANQNAVMVYDVVPEAMVPMADKGALTAETLKDIATHADIVFTSVQTGEQVKEIMLGEQGLFCYAKENTLFIDTSSIDISTCRSLHAKAKQAGFAFLDAPVSGGMLGAEAAVLTFMVGGEPTVFSRALPILEQLGKKIVHAGPAGNGQAAKLCNNMILGISMIGVCEAFAMSEKLGLDPKKLFEITSNSSAHCWALTLNNPVPGILENAPANFDYQPGFAAKMMLKDLHLSQDAALNSQSSTPLGELATKLYKRFVEQGSGELDFSAIIKMFE